MKILTDNFISQLSNEEALELLEKMRTEVIDKQDTRKHCVKIGNIIGLELFIKNAWQDLSNGL